MLSINNPQRYIDSLQILYLLQEENMMRRRDFYQVCAFLSILGLLEVEQLP